MIAFIDEKKSCDYYLNVKFKFKDTFHNYITCYKFLNYKLILNILC